MHVVNHVVNGPNRMRRREAEHYARTGRGYFISLDQFRLNDHPANEVLRTAAAAVYATLNRVLTVAEQRHVPVMPKHPEKLRPSMAQLRRRHLCAQKVKAETDGN